MIKRIMSAKPKYGKLLEARQWSRKLSEYERRKFPQLASEAYVERFGNSPMHHHVDQFKDMAELEKYREKFWTDPEFLDLIRKGDTIFIDGSEKVTLMESL